MKITSGLQDLGTVSLKLSIVTRLFIMATQFLEESMETSVTRTRSTLNILTLMCSRNL